MTRSGIGIDHVTLVEVDPAFPDADWLRKWAKERMKREAVYVPFPQDVCEQDSPDEFGGALFTIAEIEEQVRANPSVCFTGKLSLLVLDVGLRDAWFNKTLCCTDW